MEIIIGETAGFCSGVQRAIQGVTGLLNRNEKPYCLGEIIHNREVVENLKQRGMIVTDNISSIREGSTFIIRTHGLQKEIINRASQKNLSIHDFTCPKVKKIHHLVYKLSRDGYFIFIIGNPGHPEVKATASLAEGSSRVIEKLPDLPEQIDTERNAVVVQTTFNPNIFLDIVNEIILAAKKTLVYNTLCEETIRRQCEGVSLAENVDFMLVVGGKNSSNTKTLFNIVESKVTAVHIEGEHELLKTWFEAIDRVGIISGASTPEETIKKVYDTILSFTRCSIH